MEISTHEIFSRKNRRNAVKMPSCSVPYTIIMHEQFTAIDFINYITSERPYVNEWGYISIVSGATDQMYLPMCIDYRFGKIFGKYSAPYKDASLYFNDIVKEVIASGYQDRCDYLLRVVNNPQIIFQQDKWEEAGLYCKNDVRVTETVIGGNKNG